MTIPQISKSGKRLSGEMLANEDRYDSIIRRYIVKYELPFALIKAVIKAESDFNPSAVSRVGASGLMQIMKATWDWICKDIIKQDWEYDKWKFDPDRNIEVGCAYLNWLFEYFRNKRPLLELVIGAYNCGQGRVQRNGYKIKGLPKETQKYISKVWVYFNMFSRW